MYSNPRVVILENAPNDLEKYISLSATLTLVTPTLKMSMQQTGDGPPGTTTTTTREGGDHQQGPPHATPGQCGSCGSPAAHTWEAEDGLCIICGLSCFSKEARGACVADEFYSNKSTSLCV